MLRKMIQIDEEKCNGCGACAAACHEGAIEMVNGNAKLTDLDNHTCRWPLGDPKDENFHFCGRKVRIGQTYCEEHSALAYVKPIKK